MLGDWEYLYIMLDLEYEVVEICVFGKMVEKGYIYKGLKLIYWFFLSEFFLVEVEIEYKDVKLFFIYVVFNVVDGKGFLDNEIVFVIWMIIFWILLVNLGILVNFDFMYVEVKVDGCKFVIVKDLLIIVKEVIGWEEVEVL